MRTLSASSKLSGCNETGFALGMDYPPLASAIARSSADTSSEHASPVGCSASCYHVREDVGILPVVVAVGELGQVQRQVLLAHLVIGADDAAFQETPEGFQVVGVDVPAHILLLAVVDRFMRVFFLQLVVPGGFIRGHERDALRDRLPDKIAHGQPVGILDHPADHVVFASNRADDRAFLGIAAGTAALLVPMPILVFAADIGFVYLNFAHQLPESAVLHGRPDTMAHVPGRPVVAAPDLPVNLQGTDALLALRHEVDHLEPRSQRVVGILKHGLTDDRETVAVPSAAVFAFAHPVKRFALQSIDFLVLAARALHAIRPAFLNQKLFARFFCGEARHQCGERQWLGHRVPLGWEDYTKDHTRVSSTT